MYIAYTAKKWFQKRKKQEKQGNKNNGKNVRESVLNATSVELKNCSKPCFPISKLGMLEINGSDELDESSSELLPTDDELLAA